MKKYLLIIFLLFGAFLAGRFFDIIKNKMKKLNVNPNLGIVVIVGILCLFLGIFIGKGAKIAKNLARNITETKFKINLPVKQRNILVLSDFESLNDFKRWKVRQAHFEQSAEHPSHGKYSGKMTFSKGVTLTSILMEDFFEDNPNFGNWAGFNELRFDVYNAGDSSERLIIKIKDEDGKSWQRNIYLAPKQNTETKISIDELKDSLDTSSIRQLNFFRWEPASEAVFYMDNLCLVPNDISAETLNKTEQDPSDDPTGQDNKFLFDTQNKDFGVAVASATEKVFLDPNKFKGKGTDIVEISLAGNEYESSQLVIYAKKPLENVEIETKDLFGIIDGKEVKFGKNNIKCFVVGYVKTKRPGYSVSYVGWWPDPLEEKSTFNIKGNTLQPIWIEVYAPKDFPAGEYSGDITLKSSNSQPKNIKLKIKVWNFSLPKETHLKTAFDFYGGRLRKMYRQQEGETHEAYQARMYDLERRYYLDMIKHRIMPIGNFDLNDGPTLRELKLYLDNGLSSFAIGKYNGSSDNNWPKGAEELNALADIYRAYERTLKASNLSDKAYIYTYDEPKYGDPHVAAVTKMIHNAGPELKNMVCIHTLDNPDKYPHWGDDIDIWCVRNVVFNEKISREYLNKGKEVWMYVSGPEPPYPTLVIDYPSMAYRIIPWMCWKYRLTGYLYWCVNFWEDNPWENPMNTKWEQNGNGFLYYPGKDGPVTSIRLEVIRDSLEDYEYLYLLDERIKTVKEKKLETNNQELMKKAKDLLKIDASIVSSMSDYTKSSAFLDKKRKEIAEMIEALNLLIKGNATQVIENFTKPITVGDGKIFGDYGQLTFELYRGGTFVIDGESGFAWQKSGSYRDSAIIRSTKPLPKTYKLSVEVGEIDYDLDNLAGLSNDPEYKEGPLDENGAYLLAITDEAPIGHHTNDWWHQHRKVCIDVDNNSWGTGMPHPIFMVYFDKNNELGALNGLDNQWQKKWEKAVTYEPKAWYRIEIEKTENSFNLYVYDANGKLLKGGVVPFKYVWHEDGIHPDYFVIGDPHENYYQGSMKIKSISMPVEISEKK